MSAAYATETVEAHLFDEADSQYETLKELVASEELASMTHDLVERQLEKTGRELVRRLYSAYLVLRSEEEVAEVVDGADGVARTHVRERSRTVSSIFGPVSLSRTGYSFPGAKSVFPLDSDLNLPSESYSLEVQRRALEFVTYSSFDEATRLLQQTTGVQAGKRQVQEMVARGMRDFEAFYEERSPPLSPEKTSEILIWPWKRLSPSSNVTGSSPIKSLAIRKASAIPFGSG